MNAATTYARDNSKLIAII